MRRIYHTFYYFRLLLTGISLVTLSGQADAQVKIGTNGNIIAPASILELESNNQGLLLPRLSDTVAINALNPPNGMLIYLTKAPAVGLYVRKVTGWEFLTGSLGGNANFNSVTVAGSVTAGNFSGPLTGNATTATTAITAINSLNSAVTDDITTPAVTYPTFVTTTPGNAGLRTSNSNLRYVPATGTLIAKRFIGPLTGDVTGNATSAVDAQNTVNIRVTDDLTTATTMYPTFVSGTSGPLPPYASSARLSFIPLTGELTAPTFRGALLGNATSATSVTGNVAAVNGGTGQSIYTPGDILYASSSNSLSKLPIGVFGRVLGVNAANMPAWQLAGAGTVFNVAGTTNRITVTDPTASPIIDIASTYAGQTSINTLGTINTGTWNATAVDVAHGGTGLTTLPAGVLIGNGTSPVTTVTGPAGLVLTSTGTTTPPTYQAVGAGDMILSIPQTVTGAKTFGVTGDVGKLIIAGSSGGLTTLNANISTTGTVVLPSSGTLASLDGVETMTNKTLFSPNLTGTPNIGQAVGTSLTTTGNLSAPILVSTIGTGTAPFTVTSTTPVPNLSIGGNAATATSTTNFSGSLTGDVTGTQVSTVVSLVGGVSATNVATGANLANGSTQANSASTIVRRNASGNFSAGTITANLTGDVTGSLIGNAQTATTATTALNATNTAITDDNSTATAQYPTFVSGTSGNLPQKTSSNGLTYVPSTGLLTAIRFESTVATGQSPFTVSSTTPVANLAIGGNAGTASALFTPRTINGTSFDGTANITVTADASTLTGTTLKSTVVNSSLTTLGTVTAGTWNGSLIAGQFGGTGVANTGKTITLGGNLTTSGANALTLTTTALTNVTLPVSGTLYGTLAGSISSSNLLGSLSGTTGNGNVVFSNGPVLSTPNIGEANANTLRGNSTTPTGSLEAGITGKTVTGTNIGGTVQVISTGVAGGADIITITYAGGATFPLASYPVLYPASSTTAALTGTNQVFATGTGTTFKITAGSGGLGSGTYIWNYHVIGN